VEGALHERLASARGKPDQQEETVIRFGNIIT
jgi:hypothetical protein